MLQYSKVVDFKALENAGGTVITCVFKDDGRVLSVFAKRARGLLARHVVMSRVECISDLETFTAEGYRLDTAQSEDGLLVFTRSKGQRPSNNNAPPSITPAAAVPSGKKRARSAPVGSKSKPEDGGSKTQAEAGRTHAVRTEEKTANTGKNKTTTKKRAGSVSNRRKR